MPKRLLFMACIIKILIIFLHDIKMNKNPKIDKKIETMIEKMVLDNKTYTEIYNILNFLTLTPHQFKIFCNRSILIRNAQKKRQHDKKAKIQNMIEHNMHISDIQKMYQTSLGNIYRIANNNNLCLPTKKTIKTNMLMDTPPDTITANNTPPVYSQNYAPEFTIFYLDKDNKPQIPHPKQCNFIMSSTDKIDYYCHNHAVEILTKKNYCMECYFKAHTVPNRQKDFIIKHYTPHKKGGHNDA